MDKEKTIAGLINMAIGEASVCWDKTPDGVFESTKAAEISKRLQEDIKGILLRMIDDAIGIHD